MHGREIKHIIARKRARKATSTADQSAVVKSPQPIYSTQLDIDLEAAWACFEDLDGPTIIWRIHTMIERGLSSRVFNLRGPKREVLRLDTIEDIVRIVRSRAQKGNNRYEYKKSWFGADAGPRTKKEIVYSHRDLVEMPTKRAIYDWLKHINTLLSTGLADLVGYYELTYGTPRMVERVTRIQALMQLDIIRERRKRAARYQRVRQSIRLHTDYAYGGGWSNQPKRRVPRKGARTRLKGWETPRPRKKV